MSFWTVWNKVRDPLGELPNQDERKLRRQYHSARQKVRVLGIALRHGGDAGQELKQAETELSDVVKSTPRGHTGLFVFLCV